VADFGIASAVGMDSLTMTGTVLGTAGYLSPEQAQGERATPASDRYALGVVAFELLTGSRPFEADTPTAEASAHVNAPVPSVSARADLPPEIDRCFERALAKDPDRRFGTCADFVATLRAAVADAAGQTRPLAAAPATAATRTIPRPPSRSSAAWPLLVALLAAGAVAGGLLAYFLTRGDSSPTAPTTIVTHVQTVTTQGRVTTVEQPATVTTSPTTTSAASPPPSGQSGVALNNAGFAKMQAGDYAGALPLLEQAVSKLDGTGRLDEAYAKYNLAYTRFQLGNCDGVLDLLDQAEAIEGQKSAIDQLRAQAQQDC
jgi:serine/threonine protein kinase